MRLSTYNALNFFIIITVGIVFSYSYFFYPNSHPVGCLVKKVTGKDCSACGLSRAFSAFTHGKWEQGKNYNPLALNVFLFFLIQGCYRAIAVLYERLKKQPIPQKIIYLDAFLTILYFLYCFSPFILVI